MNKTTRTLIWLLGWILLLLVVLLGVAHIIVERSHAELTAYSEELEKRGEFLTIEPLLPPTPAKENNGAPALIDAMRDLRVGIDKTKVPLVFSGTEISPAKVIVGHLRDMAHITGSKDVSWDELTSLLAPLESDLAKIRDLSQSPILEVQPDYTRGLAMPLIGLTESLKAAQHLSSQSVLLLHRGDLAGALSNIETMLRLAEFTGRQHHLIAQLVSASILSVARIQTWEYLQSPFFDAEQLTSLQGAWARVHLVNAIVPMLRMDRASALSTFGDAAVSAYAVSSGTGISSTTRLTSMSWDELKSAGIFYLWRNLFYYADQRQFIENYQTLIDAAPKEPMKGPWASLFENEKVLNASMADRGIDRMFSKTETMMLTGALDRLVSIQAMSNIVVTAIALKRYVQATGSLPDSLDRLVPAYLPAIPVDPFDGQPLRYRLKGASDFLLYSIGPNVTDDHGDPTRKSSKKDLLLGADLVWPSPIPEP